jgi:hypothetical protein
MAARSSGWQLRCPTHLRDGRPVVFKQRSQATPGVSDLRQSETRRWVLNGGPLAGPWVCSPRSGLLVSNPSPMPSNNRITTEREKEVLMAQPTHRDAAMPEDHDEIKSDEIAALEREVDGLRTALGTRTLIGKALRIIIERKVSMNGGLRDAERR